MIRIASMICHNIIRIFLPCGGGGSISKQTLDICMLHDMEWVCTRMGTAAALQMTRLLLGILVRCGAFVVVVVGMAVEVLISL